MPPPLAVAEFGQGSAPCGSETSWAAAGQIEHRGRRQRGGNKYDLALSERQPHPGFFRRIDEHRSHDHRPVVLGSLVRQLASNAAGTDWLSAVSGIGAYDEGRMLEALHDAVAGHAICSRHATHPVAPVAPAETERDASLLAAATVELPHAAGMSAPAVLVPATAHLLPAAPAIARGLAAPRSRPRNDADAMFWAAAEPLDADWTDRPERDPESGRAEDEGLESVVPSGVLFKRPLLGR